MICRWKVWIPVVIFSLVFASVGSRANAAGAKDPKDIKVAAVNGTIINQAEVDTEVGRYERQASMSGQQLNPEQLSDVKKKVIDGLIDRELLTQESKKLNIKASDEEIGTQIEALKKRFPSEKDYSDALAKMSLTEPVLKAQLGKDMAIKKMIDQEVSSKITVSDEDAKKFYDEHPEYFKTPEMVRASHILVQVDPKASDADKAKAREKIADIQKKVQKGEDFAQLAQSSSDCPSKEKGGDLNFFQRGQMVKPFEDAAFALKVGEVSDIVETQFGYHLIKVTEKKEPGVTAFADVKDKIEQHLKQEKVNEQLAKYVDQLKSKAKVETFTK